MQSLPKLLTLGVFQSGVLPVQTQGQLVDHLILPVVLLTVRVSMISTHLHVTYKEEPSHP